MKYGVEKGGWFSNSGRGRKGGGGGGGGGGVDQNLWVWLSPPSTQWLLIKEILWQICGTIPGRKGGWNPRFLRAFNDWEVDHVCSLLTSLQRTFICSKANNVLVWTASKTGIFTVKSCYSLLLEANEGQFPRNMVWNSCIPSSSSFFFFFCVGSLVEKGSNYGINLRKGEDI